MRVTAAAGRPGSPPTAHPPSPRGAPQCRLAIGAHRPRLQQHGGHGAGGIVAPHLPAALTLREQPGGRIHPRRLVAISQERCHPSRVLDDVTQQGQTDGPRRWRDLAHGGQRGGKRLPHRLIPPLQPLLDRAPEGPRHSRARLMEHVLLTREIVKERAPRHPGRGDDVLDPSGLHADPHVLSQRCLIDPTASLHRAPLPRPATRRRRVTRRTLIRHHRNRTRCDFRPGQPSPTARRSASWPSRRSSTLTPWTLSRLCAGACTSSG